jgi:hypothetical protein
MRRIETYELIERYLLGRTTPEENAGIESRIKDYPSFASQVEQHRDMQQVINDYSILDVKETLSRIRKQKQTSIIRRNKFYRSMLIVGSCAIILSLSLLYIFNNNDGAVRRASEAPEASEAFTDTIVPADETESLAEDSVPPAVSFQQISDRPQTYTKTGISEDSASPVYASPDLQSGEDDASSDLQSADKHNAFPDLQSGTSDSSDLQSDSPPCNIKAEYISEPSCNNKATGVIRILEGTLINVTPPYQAVLNGEYGDSLVFRGLKPGFYRLEIKDASGCMVSLGTVIVNTKDCRYQENFYPLMELWEIPLDNQSGIIEIFNKSGSPVYRLRFDGAGAEYWNGNDLNNRALPMGLYFFIISYDDGSKFEGTVTINR